MLGPGTTIQIGKVLRSRSLTNEWTYEVNFHSRLRSKSRWTPSFIPYAMVVITLLDKVIRYPIFYPGQSYRKYVTTPFAKHLIAKYPIFGI